MKPTLTLCIAAIGILVPAYAAEPAAEKAAAAPAKTAEPATDSIWTEDFEAAKAEAAKTKKDILMDFTGSDWCGWCIKLKKEVFDKPEFAKEAGSHFVFMEVDYPQQKKQSAKVKEQNAKLKNEFKIEGYPSIVLADAAGRPYAATGYQAGGPAAYLPHLEELRKVRVARDEAMEKASKLAGLDKARALKQALDSMDDELVKNHYTSVIAEILSLDKEDSLGLKKEAEINKAMDALNPELEKLANAGKADEFNARIDKFIADQKLEGENKQNALMIKLSVIDEKKLDAAEKLMNEVIAIDGKSKSAKQAGAVLEQIKKMRAQNPAEKGSGKAAGETKE